MRAFTDALASVNRLAELSPGFVWRLPGAHERAPVVVDDGETASVVNVSVWTDYASLHDFTYRSAHGRFLRRRAEWFLATPAALHGAVVGPRRHAARPRRGPRPPGPPAHARADAARLRRPQALRARRKARAPRTAAALGREPLAPRVSALRSARRAPRRRAGRTRSAARRAPSPAPARRVIMRGRDGVHLAEPLDHLLVDSAIRSRCWAICSAARRATSPGSPTSLKNSLSSATSRIWKCSGGGRGEPVAQRVAARLGERVGLPAPPARSRSRSRAGRARSGASARSRAARAGSARSSRPSARRRA